MIVNEVAEIRKKIESEEFLHARRDDWGGAGVIITANPEREHHEGDTVVCTVYAKFIIWLLEELKPHVKVNHLSKYEYYAEFARIAIDAISMFGDNITDMLIYILENISA